MSQRRIVVLEQAVIRAARGMNVDELRCDDQTSLGPIFDAVEALDAYLNPDLDGPGAVGRNSPETSTAAAAWVAPRLGSLRRLVLDEVRSVQFFQSKGLTDDELETRLKKSHQSLSSAVNSLVAKGWLRDSGFRRLTRSGREAIVWELTDAARAQR